MLPGPMDDFKNKDDLKNEDDLKYEDDIIFVFIQLA